MIIIYITFQLHIMKCLKIHTKILFQIDFILKLFKKYINVKYKKYPFNFISSKCYLKNT